MEPTVITDAVRLVFETTLTFSSTPEEVFPLLCPVREYDWIPDWSCTMIHTISGVAELGCVFARERGETWITTRYEPPARIDYTILTPSAVRTLAFVLTASAHGTTAALRSTATALSPAGAADVLGWTADDQQRMWTLREAQANHFLHTGTMLTAGATVTPT